MIHTAYFTVGAGIKISGVSYVNGITRAGVIILNVFVIDFHAGTVEANNFC